MKFLSHILEMLFGIKCAVCRRRGQCDYWCTQPPPVQKDRASIWGINDIR